MNKNNIPTILLKNDKYIDWYKTEELILDSNIPTKATWFNGQRKFMIVDNGEIVGSRPIDTSMRINGARENISVTGYWSKIADSNSYEMKTVCGKNMYLIDEILDHKYEKKILKFLISWVGYHDDTTWENSKYIKRKAPCMTRHYCINYNLKC